MPASQHRLISDALARPDEAVACEDELVVLRRFRRAVQAKVSRRGFMIQPTSATNEHYGEFFAEPARERLKISRRLHPLFDSPAHPLDGEQMMSRSGTSTWAGVERPQRTTHPGLRECPIVAAT